jgi:branched-chain amino acid transport system substrate-binding protein
VHYAYDTVSLVKVAGSALVKAGNKNWYFLTADYALCLPLKATPAVVKANGGTVAGTVRHPLNASGPLVLPLQAQSSKPRSWAQRGR